MQIVRQAQRGERKTRIIVRISFVRDSQGPEEKETAEESLIRRIENEARKLFHHIIRMHMQEAMKLSYGHFAGTNKTNSQIQDFTARISS